VTDPTWAILIPTIPQRAESFERLLGVLLPQLDEHGGRVRVLAWRNRGTPRLAEIRDAMLADAGTDYVSFIDDDDLVPDYYVAEVVQALASRPDHVGFKLDYCPAGGPAEVVEHSLTWHAWGRSVEGVLYRDFTHVDPIRRDYALKGQFAVARPRRAEDRVWVKQVRPYLSSEAYVDKIMYHYLWSAETSSWQNPAALGEGPPRPVIDHPYFAWHPQSDS
jgi:hypothetical protein